MSVMRLTFLGTSAAQPTIRRGLSGIAVRAHSDHLLVDCGEGSQRQMLRFGTGFANDFVLFTHFHADHYLGIVGYLRTLAMGDREAPMTLYGPGPTIRTLLKKIIHLGFKRMPFPLEFHELEHGDVIERAGYRIRVVGVDHRTPCLGYVLEEPERPGRFDPDRARALGVAMGPEFGRLQRGESVRVDGGEVRPDQVLGPSRPGRKIGFSGDTRPCDALADASRDADLLVHEATFAHSELERARETYHCTAKEAGQVAARAGVRRLVLTHISSRYDPRPKVLAEEAQAEYEGPVEIAEDGMTIEVGLRDG